MINGLVTLVASKANITSLIGSSPMRFFPTKLPQKLIDFPAIAYKYYINPNNSFDGGGSLDDYMVDFFFYGKTIKAVRDLFDTFRTEIEDQTGTYDSVDITQIRYQSGGYEDYIDNLELYTLHGEYEISIER